jgi:hypothetical protein
MLISAKIENIEEEKLHFLYSLLTKKTPHHLTTIRSSKAV